MYEWSYMSTWGLLFSLNNIYFMKFQHTIIQIYILKQCTMGFRNKLSNLCKSLSLICCFSELALLKYSLQQQFSGRHIAPLGHNILIQSPCTRLSSFLHNVACLAEKQHKQSYSLWFDPIGTRIHDLPHSMRTR
jgi:hypothetical protein